MKEAKEALERARAKEEQEAKEAKDSMGNNLTPLIPRNYLIPGKRGRNRAMPMKESK